MVVVVLVVEVVANMTAPSPDKMQRKLGGFIHRFIPASRIMSDDGETKKSTRTLLLLHGTGGSEDDLLPLGREIDSDAALLSPRGKILEDAVMPRFFRRLDEGVFDLEDLKYRTNELADFVEAASKEYGFDVQNVIAVGYSNGANIASSMLLLRPEVLKGGIFFRAMVPLIPEKLPDLSAKHVLISEGLRDPIATRQQAESLYKLFIRARADVILEWQDAGHGLLEEDIIAAKQWLMRTFR